MKPRIFPLFASTARGFRASSALAITAILAALAGTHVMADTSFTTGFDGPGLDAGLSQTHNEPDTTLTVAGTAAFTGLGVPADINRRSYVSTVESDYATSTNNWTATIEVQNSGFTGAQLFFGLGTGTTVDFNDPIYGTPQGTTATEPVSFIMMYDPSFFLDGSTRSVGTVRKQFDGAYFSGEVNKTDEEFDTIVGTTGGPAAAAFYRYSMAYDALAQTLTFDVDQIDGFGGSVTSTTAGNVRVMSLAGMGYDGTNGKIFFGGNNSTFDNLSVNVTATDYNTWANSFDPDIGLPAADDDNDGVTNFEEFAFGLLPNNGSSVNPIASQLNKTNGKFSYTRRTTSGLTYSVWYSENLDGWTKDIGALEGTPVPSGDNETVEVTLSTQPGDPLPAKLFIQVRAD